MPRFPALLIAFYTAACACPPAPDAGPAPFDAGPTDEDAGYPDAGLQDAGPDQCAASVQHCTPEEVARCCDCMVANCLLSDAEPETAEVCQDRMLAGERVLDPVCGGAYDGACIWSECLTCPDACFPG